MYSPIDIWKSMNILGYLHYQRNVYPLGQDPNYATTKIRIEYYVIMITKAEKYGIYGSSYVKKVFYLQMI